MVQLHAGPPLLGAPIPLKLELEASLQVASSRWLLGAAFYGSWGCSSVGRAPGLQPGGRRFKSVHLHHTPIQLTARRWRRETRTSQSPCTEQRKTPELTLRVFFENKDGLGTQVVEHRASNNVLSVVKLQSVHGRCLGVQSRRRTWHSCEKPREAVKQALIRGSPRLGNQAGFISRRRVSVGNAGN